MYQTKLDFVAASVLVAFFASLTPLLAISGWLSLKMWNFDAKTGWFILGAFLSASLAAFVITISLYRSVFSEK